MSNKIILKKSSVVTEGVPKVPQLSDLEYGELAINYAAGTLYYKNANNTVALLNKEYTAGAGLSLDGTTFAVDNTVVRTTGSYADPAWITSLNYSKLTGTVPTWNQNTTGTSAGVVRTVTGTSSAELVRGNMADNDQARILVGGTATNAGFLEIATADDGTEPIHVRQYTGVFTTLVRTATLLDGSGNTSFPGTVTANGVTLTGNTGTVTSIATNNGITGGTITASGTIGLTGQALALHNLATNGIIARTGTGTVAGRTIAAGTGITITNGDGVSGNPTITNSAPHQATNLSYTASTRELASSTGTNVILPLATTTDAGLMASADKTKLDGIAANANNYSLPAATSTILGGIELFSDIVQTTASNPVTATASRTYGVQVNSDGQAVVNVPWVDTNTTYSLATSTVLGLIELGSDTVQTTAANAVTATASRSYALQVNSAGQGVVNVPWTDTVVTPGDGTLSIATRSSGATNTDVTLNLSGAYSANTTTNRTINAVVGPALTNLASTMTGAGSGFLRKNGQDTYTIDTNTYLTANSNDFGTIAINGTDSGYTWGAANTNTNQVADSVGDTLTFVKGGGIDLFTNTVAGTDAIKIEHADTSSAANLTASARTYVTGLTFDTYGHVTGYTTGTETVVDTNTITRLRGTTSGTYQSGDLTLVAGSNVTITQSGTDYTIAASQPTVGNGSFTVTAGAGLTGGGLLGTANQSGNTSITVSHADTSSVTDISSDNSNGTVIQDVSLTFDTYGHVTGATVGTVNMDNRYYTETEADTRFVNIDGDTMTGFLTLNADPTSALHAVTKQYVDSIAQGLHIHAPCVAATTGTLASITGGTITYNNGTAGVGATLTVSGGTFGTIDGINIATVGTRILVKNEATAANNGIYTFTSSTVLTRATDFDTPTEMAGGDFTFVQQGTLYNDTGWVMTDPVTTVGTTAANFVQFSGAGTYTAGAGLTLTGTQFAHADTSSQENVDNSGNTFVQDLVFDTYGHVTGVTSATVSIGNGTLTMNTAGIATGSQTFTANQGTNATFTVTVPGTNIAEGTRTTTTVPITSSTGTGATLSAATTSLAGVMTSADKTKLDGIAANANNYSLPAATSTVRGGVELFSDTVQTVAANAVTATASRTYGVQVNSDGQCVINVPWTDTIVTPGDGTLSIAARTAGATNTDVTLNLSGAYSANTTANRTVNAVVGPALTNLASTMTGAGSGFLRKTGQDTYTIDTNTYLTANSNDFGTVAINGTDSGYTWGAANTNTNQVADSVGDTLTFVKGGGIDLFTNTVAGTDAIKIEHADTSSAANLTASARTYVTGLTFDTYGHVTGYTTGTETVVDTNTVTRLRGTASGTYQSGDLTLLAGSNVTITQSGTDYTIAASQPTVGDGTLSVAARTAGATNTDVTLNLSGAYSANTTANRTVNAVVGPALTNLASTMTGASSGFLRKTGQDTYTIDTNTYLTGYTETDTLATVTARGATTSTALTLNGNVAIGTSASLSFGSATRQMINLWSTSFGIGIQNNTQYFRTGGRFSWFRNGSHVNDENSAGSGGVVAMTLDSNNNLIVTGSLFATSKSFLIPHPTKEGKKLRHGSLEGPEHGVYVRGKVKGNVIELPDYWTKLVDADSITVQLTAIGKGQKLYVEDIRDNKVFIANDGVFAGDPHCFYLVQAERVDIDKIDVEIE